MIKFKIDFLLNNNEQARGQKTCSFLDSLSCPSQKLLQKLSLPSHQGSPWLPQPVKNNIKSPFDDGSQLPQHLGCVLPSPLDVFMFSLCKGSTIWFLFPVGRNSSSGLCHKPARAGRSETKPCQWRQRQRRYWEIQPFLYPLSLGHISRIFLSLPLALVTLQESSLLPFTFLPNFVTSGCLAWVFLGLHDQDIFLYSSWVACPHVYALHASFCAGAQSGVPCLSCQASSASCPSGHSVLLWKCCP